MTPESIAIKDKIKPRAYLFLALIITFALSAGLGLVITMGISLTREDWWLWLLLRVLPVLISSLGLAAFFMKWACKRNITRVVVFVGFFGLFWAICHNSVLDLIAGERVLQGELSQLDFYNVNVPGDHRRKGYSMLKPVLIFTTSDGETVNFNPETVDWQRQRDLIKACGIGGQVNVSFLIRLERLLNYECVTPGQAVQ